MVLVTKFGGSTLNNLNDIEKIVSVTVDFVKQNAFPVLVLSAFYGITNKLIEIAKNSLDNPVLANDQLDDLIGFHYKLIENNTDKFDTLVLQLKSVINKIIADGVLNLELLDSVMSFGEKFSSLIAVHYLSKNVKCEYVNAEEIIKTDNNFGAANVDVLASNKLISEKINQLLKLNIIPVITGFIGSTIDNRTTTLGRNGSDYSASLVAAAVEAKELILFKDVNGVYTMDPKRLNTAKKIKGLSYREMWQLCNFGNKVIHVKTIKPIAEKNIPIIVNNIDSLDSEPTIISSVYDQSSKYDVTGIGYIEDISLIIIKDNAHTYTNTLFNTIFNALRESEIDVMLMTKSAIDSDLYFSVKKNQLQDLKNFLDEKFKTELYAKTIEYIVLENQSIIAIVGEKMISMPNICGRVFDVIGKNNINIVSIFSNALEINILLSIESNQTDQALRLLHDTFFDEKI